MVTPAQTLAVPQNTTDVSSPVPAGITLDTPPDLETPAPGPPVPEAFDVDDPPTAVSPLYILPDSRDAAPWLPGTLYTDLDVMGSSDKALGSRVRS